MTRKPVFDKHRLGSLFACFTARYLANTLASLCLRGWATAAVARRFLLGFLIDLTHLFQGQHQRIFLWGFVRFTPFCILDGRACAFTTSPFAQALIPPPPSAHSSPLKPRTAVNCCDTSPAGSFPPTSTPPCYLFSSAPWRSAVL